MLIDGEEKWRIRRKPKRIKKGKLESDILVALI